MRSATVLDDFQTGDYMRWGGEAEPKFLFWSDELTEVRAGECLNSGDEVGVARANNGHWMAHKVAANDNGYVNLYGGGNTNPTLEMLERMHGEISYVNPHRPDQKSTGGAYFVYVIGGLDPEHIKIGKASSVVSRLRQLQTGNPLKLYVHRVFGFEKTSDTTKLEAWAHQDASRLFSRAVGEWFRCGTVEAHDLIAEICEKERIKCSVRTPKIEAKWQIVEEASQRTLAREREHKRVMRERKQLREQLSQKSEPANDN